MGSDKWPYKLRHKPKGKKLTFHIYSRPHYATTAHKLTSSSLLFHEVSPNQVFLATGVLWQRCLSPVAKCDGAELENICMTMENDTGGMNNRSTSIHMCL
jgi:hypothetical protein